MARLSDVIAYQSGVEDLTTLALRDLFGFWRSLGGAAPDETAGQMRDYVPALIDTYHPASAEIGAEFYDEVRIAANVPVPHTTVLADPPQADKVQDRLSWALAPLFRRDTAGAPVMDLDAAMSRTVAEVQLEVAGGARDTVSTNVEQDRGTPRFARHASANACAFCRVMAIRGSVFRTAEAAGNGKKYHSNCHCVAYPVFPDEDDESAPYVVTWENDYRAARKAAKRDKLPPDLTNVLRYMRLDSGAA